MVLGDPHALANRRAAKSDSPVRQLQDSISDKRTFSFKRISPKMLRFDADASMLPPIRSGDPYAKRRFSSGASEAGFLSTPAAKDMRSCDSRSGLAVRRSLSLHQSAVRDMLFAC